MEEYVCTKCTLGIEFIDERESLEEAVFEGTVEDGNINEHNYEKCSPQKKCKSFTKCKDL